MNDVTVGSVEIGIAHEGKYGFYCVDKTLWIKIKYIRKYYQEALRHAHSWQRYYSKAKHNRRGSTPELSLRDLVYCELASTTQYVRKLWFPKKYLQTQRNHESFLELDIRIQEIYNIARIPYKTEEEAKKYSVTKVQLDIGRFAGIGYYVDMMYKKLIEASV